MANLVTKNEIKNISKGKKFSHLYKKIEQEIMFKKILLIYYIKFEN